MDVLRMLYRASRSVTLLAVLCGLISGLGSAALLALINLKLGGGRLPGVSLAAAFALLVALVPLARVLSSYLAVRLSQRAVHALRLDLARRILATPLRRLEEIGPHRLHAAVAEDMAALGTAFASFPVLCVQLAVCAASLGYLAWVSLPTLGLLLILLAFGLLTYHLPMAAAMGRQRLARIEADELHHSYRGIIDGTKELQLQADHRRGFLARMAATAGRLQRFNTAAAAIHSGAAAWGQILVFVAIGLLLFGAGGSLPRAALVSFSLVTLYLLAPLQVILNTLPDFGRAQVAWRHVQQLDLALAGGEPAAAPPPPAPRPAWRRLELVGVEHSYGGEQAGEEFVLGPIDLALGPGELVFVIGGNGSGKTTLAKLLVGLYSPAAGEVRLDGKTITAAEREAFRQQFAAVFSDFYLFDSLAGGGSGDADRRARRYLERLRLADKVAVAAGELSTTALSQGQRKRLALLNALLLDRPIYLFDEWAADQDPQFKEIFYLELLPELKARGKTVIVITHDDRYFAVADRVVKLEMGKLVGDAPPAAAAGAVGGVGARARGGAQPAGLVLPPALLEEWMRKHYFDAEIDIGSSGVEDFSLAEIEKLLGFSAADLERVVFHDSRTLGGTGLRTAIAERWAAGEVERVMATHGSTEACFLVMSALLAPGDEVLAVDPCYQQLHATAAALGCRVRRWPLRFENGFRPDFAELEALLAHRPAMVVVNFPHNPTGVTLTAGEQRELAARVAASGAYLLWDGAFSELALAGRPLPEIGALYERGITLGTLSKTCGLPGLRVGWCIAPEAVLAKLVQQRDYLTLHLSPLVELIAEQAVRGADRLVAPRLVQARSNLRLVAAWMDAHEELVEWVPPAGGVVAFPRLRDIADATPLCRQLIERRRVLLVPGSCFGRPAHVRLGFGGPSRQLQRGLDHLSELLCAAAAGGPIHLASKISGGTR